MSVVPGASELRSIDAGDVVARAAAGFEDAPAELGLLDADNLLRLFDAPDIEGGRTGLLAMVTPGGVEILLRPFQRGGWLARLGAPPRLASPQRWFEEIRVTQLLRERGAPVPQPAFAIACRTPTGPRGWRGAVATVRIPDASDAANWLEHAAAARDIGSAARSCGRAVRGFHDRGGRHPDLHIGNLLVSNSADQAWVIDLDRARAGEPPSARRRARELARLLRSTDKRQLRDVIGEAGFRAFLDAYVDGDSRLGEAIARAWRSERLAIGLHRLGY